MARETGWYVYAFLSFDAVFSERAPIPLAGIDGQSPLSLIAENGIGVVLSQVPLDEFGEETLRDNLQDLPWLEEKVRLHEAIVEAALARGPILPMKFGTIFLELEGIRRVIRRNAPALQSALEDLREMEEWGVKGFANRAVLQANLLRSDPALLALSDSSGAKPPGEAFFLKRRLAESARVQTEERGEALAREALDVVRGTVAELLEHSPLIPGPVPGAEIVLNLACLVRREGKATFLAGVERWNRVHAEEGLRLVASGPWPPYHFVPRLCDDG